MLGAGYVEYIHDALVTTLWPGSDPVSPGEYRNRGLIESAVSRPFQSAFGEDVYPGIVEKAAALFHSLVANHPFHNGNKRTAVIAVDQFLLANGFYLLLSNTQFYVLAERVASYKELGLSHDRAMAEIRQAIQEMLIPLAQLRAYAKRDPSFVVAYRGLMRARRRIRSNPHNRLFAAPA